MSLFGKKTTDKERRERGNEVRFTGGRIDVDREEKVTDSIVESLRKIGSKQSDLVVSSCLEYINKKKPGNDHKVILYKVMELVCRDNLNDLEEELCNSLVVCCANEMTASKDIKAELMDSSCALLVRIGHRFDRAVMDELLNRFETGKVPPFFVMKAIGDYAQQEPMFFVKRISDFLKRILPVLGLVKQDNMKWVFAAAIGHIAEAVKFYSANVSESDKDASAQAAIVDTRELGPELYSSFDYMAINWLTSKESQIRLATIEAMGHICGVLSVEHYAAAVPRVVPAMLQLYRKERNFLPITQGLSLVLEEANSGAHHLLEPHLMSLLGQLHGMICMPVPDNAKEMEMVIKNNKETLRCIELITMKYSAHVIPFLLGRLEERNTPSRVGSLVVLKHLISRLDANVENVPVEECVLEGTRSHIVSGVRILIDDPALPVKVALSQLIITMASQKYLNLEGGHRLVDFIITQCSLTDTKLDGHVGKKKPPAPINDGSVHTWGAFRDMCDSVLLLLTTTLPHMIIVMWPYLFHVLGQSRYQEGTAVVAKCLADIATKKRANEDEDYYIDFDKHPNIPKPAAIISRCFVMLSLPFERNNVGSTMLELLKGIAPILHPALEVHWDELIPKFQNYLDAHGGEEWNQVKWENQLLRWISESVDQVNDDEWSCGLADAFMNEYSLYGKSSQNVSDYHRMSLRFLGKVLAKVKNSATVRKCLDFMLSDCDHSVHDERVGCACGIGYIASNPNHLDIVLDKLLAMTKNEMTRKSTGFLGLSKDKTIDENIPWNYSSYVVAFAPGGLVTSRIEMHITPNFLPVLLAPPKMEVKENLMSAMVLIGQALHSSRLNREYTLKSRDDMLNAVIRYISGGAIVRPAWVHAQHAASQSKDPVEGVLPGAQPAQRPASTSTPPAVQPAPNVLEPLLSNDLPETVTCNSIIGARVSLLNEAPKKEVKKGPAPAEPVFNIPLNVRVVGLKAAMALLALEPQTNISASEGAATAMMTLTKLLELNLGVATSTKPLPDDKDDDNKENEKDKKSSPTEAQAQASKVPDPALSMELLECLSGTFRTVLTMECSVSNLNDLICIISPYLQDKSVVIRERACEILKNILQEYIDIKTGEGATDTNVLTSKATDRIPNNDVMFKGVGIWCGLLVPRLTDISLSLRECALDCLENALYIDDMLRKAGKGNRIIDTKTFESSAIIEELSDAKTASQTDNPQELYAYTKRVAHVLSECLQAGALQSCLGLCIEGLLDTDVTSANSAIVILHCLLKERGSEVLDLVPDIIKCFKVATTKMDPTKHSNSIQGIMHATRTLGIHHRDVVLEELMKSPMPFSDKVTQMIQSVSRNAKLLDDVMNLVMDILNATPTTIERPDKDKKKEPLVFATRRPMAATAVLNAMLQTPEMADYCESHYAEVVSTVLLRIGSAAGRNQDPKEVAEKEIASASAQAVDALSSFVSCTNNETLGAVLTDDLKTKLKGLDTFAPALMTVVDCICEDHDNERENIYKFISQFNTRDVAGHRAAVCATMAEFVNHAYVPLPEKSKTKVEAGEGNEEEADDDSDHPRECDSVALQTYLNCLLANAADKSKTVRLLCIRYACCRSGAIITRGLGNLAQQGEAAVNKFANAVLNTLLNALEDSEDDIAIEAMTSLGRLFALIGVSFISQMLHNICQRIRNAFESENAKIRKASLSLFGALNRFGSGDGRNALLDNIHTNLPAIVVHLKDDGEGVYQASRQSLLALSPLFGSIAFDELMHGTPGISPESNDAPLDYEAFVHELSRIFVKDFYDRVRDTLTNTMTFFTSKRDDLKSASATFAGYLLLEMDPQNRKQLSVETISRAYIALLKEKNASVRNKAVQAMSLLFDY